MPKLNKNILELISSSFIFLLIFSFFNDNYMVNHFGDNSLKLLFIIFFVFYANTIYKTLKGMTLMQDKIFFSYAISLTIIFLMKDIVNMSDNFVKQIFTIISLYVVVIFFSRYNLNKLIYFIWISIAFSGFIAYFNPPLTEWTFRTTGGTGDPNEFAAQLLTFFFSSIYLYNINKSKLFLSFSIVLFVNSLFLAGSKSSFAILALVLLIVVIKYILFNIKKIMNYKFFSVILLLLIVSLNVNINNFTGIKNMKERAKSSGTLTNREASWNGGYHMTVANPFLGVGLGDYGKYTRKYATVYVSATAPHNIYVKLVAESGIFVFLVFLFFVFILLFQNFKKIFNTNYFWIYMSFLSLLLMGMTIGITYDKYFLLYIAIMLNTNYLINQKEIL